MERRRKPRIEYPFPVSVRGVDVAGKPFRVSGVLNDISASGLYMHLKKTVSLGSSLAFVIRLSSPESSKATAARIAIRGEVVRVEPSNGNSLGIAVRFTDYRFL
ncbi:MAG TPA: PilZ domain-containing protein [Blastocatellia bacterium]|nr:PilZ domain-containing protein [Blastocatellia bacterium]